MTRWGVAKAVAVQNVEAIADELYATHARPVKRAGAIYVVSPKSASRTADQMRIHRTGPKAGGWSDYAGGQSGDAIDLVAWALEGVIDPESRKRAVAWIEDRFGIRKVDAATREEWSQRERDRQAAAALEEADRRASSKDRARKMFHGASASLAGTLGEIYLSTRGVVLADVAHLSPDLRFQPRQRYWLERDARGEQLVFPAIVSAMRDASGTLGACHVTYLAVDGTTKAPVEKPKLMWPETHGLSIRVTDGPSGLSPEKAIEAGAALDLVGVTEGIEDALTAAMVEPKLRMQAAGSLAGLLALPDHPCARGYLVFRDNDWSKPQAVALFDRAIARLRSFGKPVEVAAVPPDWGKDMNDALNA